eukprot:TRINITY_DN2156_c0_g1_i5.p1 TRINITY_DN2156_c0_g1~~TRINITY_DN2156_c0_g1_i5.p1  ORF type:complete len:385 (+),score=55.80 TRINITY_DN2156_c0_g1_i5:114-1268(+)
MQKFATYTPSFYWCSNRSRNCHKPYRVKASQQNILHGFSSVESVLEDVKQGKPVVVLDDESRENEGDLIVAADQMSVETMAFIVEYSSGVICVGMRGEDLDRLQIPLMVEDKRNEESMYTAFTVTVDAWNGTTTGISAADRTITVKLLGSPDSKPNDFRKPGHLFPLRSRRGGVLERPGHTEASVDLAYLAGCFPAGVLCEIVDKRDGSMARGKYLMDFARSHDLKCLTVKDLQMYRLRNEQQLQQIYFKQIDDRYFMTVFRSILDDTEHVLVERITKNANGHAKKVRVQLGGGQFLQFFDQGKEEAGQSSTDIWIYIGRKQQVGFREQLLAMDMQVKLSEVESSYVSKILRHARCTNFEFVGNVSVVSEGVLDCFGENSLIVC